jgi:hypothetical protein
MTRVTADDDRSSRGARVGGIDSMQVWVGEE